MCGITVIFDKNPDENKYTFKGKAVTTVMLDAIRHRGKDQWQIDEYSNCTVGYIRLAITERFTTPKFNKWKIYLNGEIYNYKYFGFDGSEVEVISQCLEKYGPDIVKQFNGMFFFVAVGLHPDNQGQVLCFRDRYGIKPAYYYETTTTIIIASEIKAILKYPTVRTIENESVKKQWFVFNNCLTDETLFSGIKKLDKATVWNLNTNTKNKFWEWKFEPNNNITIEDATLHITRLMKQAMDRQKPKEVDYTSCLSGGIDSNVIGVHLNPMSKTYTVGYNGEENEFELAELSKRCISKITMYSIHYLSETIYHLEDLRVGASWANYSLYKHIASDKFKVCFDGAGADELFAGYTWRYSAKDYYNVVNRTGIEDEYCKDLFQKIFPEDTLQNRYLFDCNYFLEGVLLVVDRLSMAHTIEMRVPFLDNDLVDFCLKLPEHLKKEKFILKEAFKNDIHADIINGKKRGFSSPDWFGGSDNKALNWANAAYSEWQNKFIFKNNF